MNTALKMDTYEHQALIWSGGASRETSEELIVPDSLPDVGTVIAAEGVLCLRGKQTETGSVQLSALVSVSVLYTPEGGGAMRSLELTLPADMRLEAPGTDGECRTVASMRLRSVEARVLNSRKLSIRAEVESQAQCYRLERLELASSLVTDEGAAHILTRTAEAMLISDVREKTFVTTDEYQMPAGAETILSRRVEALVEDVKYAGGKVIFRGRVRSEMLFTDGGDRILSARYETEFSQLMEADAAGEGEAEAQAQVTLLLTGAYFDPPEYGQEHNRLAAEFHFAAQTVLRQRRELCYIADIYSNRTQLEASMRELTLVQDVRAVSMRQTVAGRIELLSPGGDGQTLSVSADVGGVTVESGSVKTSVGVGVISRDRDGVCSPARCRLTAEFTSPELAGGTLRDVAVTVVDVYSAGSEIRVTLQMDATLAVEGTVQCVNEVTEDSQAWKTASRLPSATLIHVPAGTELWPLARRYHSTLALISSANDGRQDGLLLIPKGR